VKSKARADRWNEELRLVKEEMRRVITFLEWKAGWWAEGGRRRLDVRPDIASGIRAYAAKQASINHALAHSFKTRWESIVETEPQDYEQDGNKSAGEVDEYDDAEYDTDMD
jgi:hypothetical protein